MRRRIIGTGVLGAVLLLATWLPASAAGVARADGNPNPGILPPPGPWYGGTYNGWSAAWWQYVLAQPKSSNPLNDPTGANCRAGQSGQVFFLVGTNGPGSATRDQCTVPAGKALFFPLVNEFALHVRCTPQTQPTGICDTVHTPQLVWNDMLVPAFNYAAATNLHATIDGVQVGNLGDPATTPYRACVGPFTPCSPASFSSTFPTDNLFAPALPAGTYSPTVADGFYLLLAPLTPGPHTITFGGTNTLAGTQDITYHLTVSAS